MEPTGWKRQFAARGRAARGILEKVWKDAVWSKVIASGIIAMIALACARLWPGSFESNQNLSLHEQAVSALPTAPVESAATSGPRTQRAAPEPLGEAVLKNFTYTIDENFVTLVNGQQDADISRGVTQSAYLVSQVLGDLDGDDIDDALAIIATNGGGSAIFSYIVTVLSTKHGAMQVGRALSLGDRIGIERMAVNSGGIMLHVMTHGEDDAMCCPSVPRVIRFEFVGNNLQCTTEPCLHL